VGFRHIFGAAKAGWAAIGTSARELGELTGAALDLEAVSVLRLIGHYLDSDPAYAGVSKLPAAHFWTLADGRLSALRYPERESETGKDPAPAHARRLRDLVAGFLGHHDDVRLELSGGLDSRMVLAAVPPERRKRLTAFTIVAEGSRDAHVAGELARRYGMGCELVNVADLAKLDPAQAHELARALFGPAWNSGVHMRQCGARWWTTTSSAGSCPPDPQSVGGQRGARLHAGRADPATCRIPLRGAGSGPP